MTRLAPAGWWRGLAGLTRSGSAVEGLSWALYDFANTIFSFAIVSFAMSLWAIRFLGEAGGQFWFTFAVSVSVLINAAVSPVLGAMSDAYQIANLSLLVLMVIGFLIVRRVPEGMLHPDPEARLHPALEPAIVPPGEAP